MKNDPLSIIIALNLENKSDGIIYFDDEESLEYQNNKYSILKISYEKSEIDFDWMLYNYQVYNNIEKIIILGENNELLYNKLYILSLEIQIKTTKTDKNNSFSHLFFSVFVVFLCFLKEQSCSLQL